MSRYFIITNFYTVKKSLQRLICFVALSPYLLSAFQGKAQGALSVSMSDNAIETNVDLTNVNNTDWAIWGTGSSISLSPDNRKNTVSLISDLTPFINGPHPLRGLGQFGAFSHTFQWTDGIPLTTAFGVNSGLQVNTDDGNSIGEGFQFTVPAQTYEQKLVIYAGHHLGKGKLTGLISGSALSFTQYTEGNGNNMAVKFTITFKSATPNQTLTINWVLDAVYDSNSNVQLFTAVLSTNHILPLELLDFTGKNTEEGNLLTWTTANEVNNKGFQVERRTGDSQWATGDSWSRSTLSPLPKANQLLILLLMTIA